MLRWRAKSAMVLLLAVVLGGCGSSTFLESLQDRLHDFDPFGTRKKPLPGERKLLFPEGVPGVQQGIPPELMRGHQTATLGETAPGTVPSGTTLPDAGAAPRAPRAAPSPAAAQPLAVAPRQAARSERAAAPAPRKRTAPQAEARAARPQAVAEPREDSVWPAPPSRTSASPAPQASPWPAPPAQASPWPAPSPPASTVWDSVPVPTQPR